MASHPSSICTAVVLTGLPIRIRIAAGVPPHQARRDRSNVLTFRSIGLAQFRSAALAGADWIIGGAIAVAAAVGARVERVFAVLKVSVSGALHEPNVDRGAERDAPQFEAPGA